MQRMRIFGAAVVTVARSADGEDDKHKDKENGEEAHGHDGDGDEECEQQESTRHNKLRSLQSTSRKGADAWREARTISVGLLMYAAIFSVLFAGTYAVTRLLLVQTDGESLTWSLAVASSVVVLLVSHQIGLFRPRNAPPLARSWLPYIGHWYEFWEDPVAFCKTLRQQYGDVVAIRMAGFENVFVFEKNSVRTIMLKPEEDLSQLNGVTNNGTFLPLMGENLPVTFHEQERMKNIFRKKMTPLARKLTLDFGRTMQSICNSTPDCGEWSSTDFFYNTMIRLSAKIVVGEEMEGNQEFRDITMYLEHLVTVAERTMSFGWPLVYWKSKTAHRRLRELLMPIIDERRRWQRENPTGWVKSHGMKDLLSMALDDFKENDGECTDEADANNRVLLILSAIMFGLAANTPNVAENLMTRILHDRQLYAEIEVEIDTVCKQHEGTPLWEIPHTSFPLLSASVLEIMRVYPDLTIPRGTQKKTLKLPNGYEASPGTVIQIVPKVLHDEVSKREDPHIFDPRQMAKDGIPGTLGDMPFLGWGYGRHLCPGMRVAKGQLNVAIGMLIKHFDMALVDDDLPEVTYSCRTTPKLDKPVGITYTRRHVPLG